jgi:alpha-amylase/alpha-mannosidase (GH57 family)
LERYICIHGHFYQPPRENPWLDAIETQDSAAPFHDWNERITAECYAPNGAARILDEKNRIADIVNNYARISYNFGPTLLSWMQRAAPDVYATIIAADLESRERFGGHGSAMAQAYHHGILPLSNTRDKQTEIRWGVRDFVARYGRAPEGMWLSEAAVDLETLDLMAGEGLTFAVLAPYQADRVRPIGSEEWHDASAGRIDTTRAYLQRLPSGRTIALFFYDGMISRGVAFEGLLNRGEDLAGRLLGAFSDKERPELVHIATDGETYGHHHRFGEMALAYALHYIESTGQARLTNYGQFLELHPPEYEVDIREQSSWSCFHGVERWRSDCGCNTGGQPGWRQAWRAPLRNALDWLRDMLAPRFEQAAGELFCDPWAARDDYISVLLDRSDASIDAFLARHARPGAQPERVRVLLLMEMQRNTLMMYTSCGWFFSEVSGLETVQVMQYASRAIQLARDLFGIDLQTQFLARLRKAPSNLKQYRSAADVYQELVKPLIVELPHVAAHYALASLFSESDERAELYAYQIERRDHHLLEAGRAHLAIGKLKITSRITHEAAMVDYGALHLGAQTLLGGVRAHASDSEYQRLTRSVRAAFGRADVAEVLQMLNAYFNKLDYSLRSMFRDQQRAILGSIMARTLSDIEADYLEIYTQHTPLMRFLADLNMPQPAEFYVAASFTLGAALRRTLALEEPDVGAVRALLDDAQAAGVKLETNGAAHTLALSIEQIAAQFAANPTDLRCLQDFAAIAEIARIVPFEVDMWRAQNNYYTAQQRVAPPQRARAEAGDAKARRWLDQFARLGELLRFRVAA